MKKAGLSIRYKILLLLTLIPLITLGVYLALALKIFEEDKVAYVFDSSSNVTGAISAQIKSQLVSALKTAKPIFQDYLDKKNFTSFSESIFNNEQNFDLVSVFSYNKEKNVYQRDALLEKSPQAYERIVHELGSRLSIMLKDCELKERVVQIPFHDDRVFLLEKITDNLNNKVHLFLMVIKLSETAEIFKSTGAQLIYLINTQGQILLGPEKDTTTNFNELYNTAFLKNKESKISQGAETVEGEDKSSYLISFSKLGFGDLMIVSSVAKSKALGALQILIRKSLIFFGILICVTVIVSMLASNTITQALTALFDATKKVSEGHFDIRVKVNSSDEVGILADNFNIMAAEVSRLLDETANKARMENELQTAKTVQETLFPEARSEIGTLKIHGFYEPASECGGDWWHYCKVGDKVFLWIGDATGHGAPAALITSAAKSAATIIEKLNVSPGQALELLNRCIYDVSKGRLMMTFFIASFDQHTSELIYANASHEAPYLIKKSDTGLKKKDLIPLNEVVSPRLGQDRETKYAEAKIKLDKGDSLFLYTDGIPDIKNPNGDSWGEREFLKALVNANKNFPSVDVAVKEFSDQFQEFRSGTTLIDDVTFFMVKNE